MTSHEANPMFYDPSDWQLTKTAHSYESSKFQMDLIVYQLDQASFREESDGLPVRHLTVLPGVAGTSIADALLGTLSSIGCSWLSIS
jgi:3-keto steroid reductase